MSQTIAIATNIRVKHGFEAKSVCLPKAPFISNQLLKRIQRLKIEKDQNKERDQRKTKK